MIQLVWIKDPNGKEYIIIDTHNYDDAGCLEEYAVPTLDADEDDAWELERVVLDFLTSLEENTLTTKFPTNVAFTSQE